MSTNRIPRFFTLFFLSIAFGIADYYVCDLVVYVLKFPIFCDMIFCLAMSFFAGPLWGIFVVISNHLFDMLVSHSFVIEQMYMMSAFFGCLIAWFYKKYCMREEETAFVVFARLLLLVLIMCVAMSVTGGIISRIVAALHDDGSEYTYQIEFLKLSFGGKLKYPLLDAILLRLPINLVDRFITVFAGWGVFAGMEKIARARTK